MPSLGEDGVAMNGRSRSLIALREAPTLKAMRFITAATAALLMGALVTAPATATSGGQKSSTSPADRTHSQKPVKGGPLDLSDPRVVEHDTKIRKSGVKVLSASTTMFVEDGKPDKVKMNAGDPLTPMLFPSGCGLSVWVYQDGGRIISSSLTSCPFAFSTADMDSWLGFYAWFSYNNQVASNVTYSGPASSFTNDYAYWCANGNNTSYRTETYGELYLGGTRYSAAAYDELTDVPCGT